MLSSIVSTITSSTLSVTSTVFSTEGISDSSVVAVICLIGLLAVSVVLSESKLWNKRLSIMLNLTIIPMTAVFALIVCFHVMSILK